MATWLLAVIAAVAVLIIALVVIGAVRARRRAALKRRFGPEYDRTVEGADSRRKAERELDERTLIDLLQVPRTGENANHICLVVEPADFDAMKASGRFEVVDGPDTRWGAQGDATSLYVKDPDGNVVELRYY